MMKKIFLVFTLLAGIIAVFLVKEKDQKVVDNKFKNIEKKKKKVIEQKKQVLNKIEEIKDVKINSRQSILLTLINQHKSLPMKEIEKRIQTVNVRTLRRDLDKLQKYGMVDKSGSTKAAVYHSKKK